MSIATSEFVFADANAQAEALATVVGTRLREAVAERGAALLAVPGGATPRQFLQALARQKADWSCITVVLTDERLVAADNPRSNARLLREVLLERVPARFVPLQREAGADVDSAAITSALQRPFDAVVLGMGADGHCASLFVDGDNIAAALRADAPELAMTMRSPSVAEARVTLTLAALVDTRALFVLIQGAEKRRTLDAALRGEAPFDRAPIRAVLAQAWVAPQVYWCP